MSRRSETIPATYFDGLYTDDADPWRFGSSPYEAGKYAATLAALTRPHYATALEVGCSIGIFTAMLAPRCGQLLALDGSAVALEGARQRGAHLPQVTFEQRMVPQDYPSGRFDLIVLSEVLYYLTPDDLAAVATRTAVAQGTGGEILLCHWLGETDYPLTGADASNRFVASAAGQGYAPTLLHDETYRLVRLLRR